MKKKKNTLLSIMAIVGLTAFSISAQAQQQGVRRVDLQKHDLSIPGHEAVQVRVELGPGVLFPRHKHPGEEIIYVLEGLIEYKIDGKPAVTLKPGDVLFVPAGAIHSAKNVGTGNAAELATYIVDKTKPLSVIIR